MDRAIRTGAERREETEKAEQAAQASKQSEEITANELWRQLRASVETEVDRYNSRVGESDRIKVRESGIREVTYSKASSSSQVTLVMGGNAGLTRRTRFGRGPNAGVSGTESVFFRVEGDRLVLDLPSMRSDSDDLVRHVLEDLIES